MSFLLLGVSNRTILPYTTFNYCPQDTTGFYDINFNQDKTFGTVNYCPQDTTGFYTISFNLNLNYSTTNYCPQDTANFYDFATAP